jgi:hypothetical protein
VIVGDAGQQRPLGDELIAEVAPDDLDRRLDGWEDLGQRVEVLPPGLARNLLWRSTPSLPCTWAAASSTSVQLRWPARDSAAISFTAPP